MGYRGAGEERRGMNVAGPLLTGVQELSHLRMIRPEIQGQRRGRRRKRKGRWRGNRGSGRESPSLTVRDD
jgi:hypothetical protein